MAKRAKEEEQVNARIPVVEYQYVEYYILGTAPLLYNALHSAASELINPQVSGKERRKTELKHNPWLEYRNSVYAWRETETFLCSPGVWFKKAACAVTTDLEGWQRAPTERAMRAVSDRVPVYGIPMLDMRIVRLPNKNRTPDVRTRAIVPEWASKVTIRFESPTMSEPQVTKLLALAGQRGGVGDGRPQKGCLSFGTFELVEPSDKRWKKIVAETTRKKQIDAMNYPDAYFVEAEGWLARLVSELSIVRGDGGTWDPEKVMAEGRFSDDYGTARAG